MYVLLGIYCGNGFLCCAKDAETSQIGSFKSAASTLSAVRKRCKLFDCLCLTLQKLSSLDYAEIGFCNIQLQRLECIV